MEQADLESAATLAADALRLDDTIADARRLIMRINHVLLDTRALRHAQIDYLLREGADLAVIDSLVGYLSPSAKVRYRSLAAGAPVVALGQIDPVHPAARSADTD